MGLKEKIESNAVIFFLGTLLIGFLSGIGAYKAIIEIAKLEVISKTEINKLKDSNLQLNRQLSDIKSTSNNSEKIVKEYQSEIKDLNTAISNFQNEKTELNQKLRNTEEINNILNKNIAKYQAEINSLKKQLREKDKDLENEKKELMKEKSSELKKWESDLKVENDKLNQERAKIDNIKLAQRLMEQYLEECAHVDIRYQPFDAKFDENPMDYRKAISLLNALEAVAYKISDDNEFLEFVNSQRRM
jgi:chromosome segregation ATPase